MLFKRFLPFLQENLSLALFALLATASSGCSAIRCALRSTSPTPPMV